MHSDTSELRTYLQHVEDLIITTVENNCSDKLLEVAQAHLKTKGKMLRPKVIYCLGRIFNVPDYGLVRWAACCELLHNATLVHDDLQDGDHVRRGVPTIWKQFGPEQAVNLGDFFILVAPQTIFMSALDDKLARQLNMVFSHTATHLVNGQSIEFDLKLLKSIDTIKADYFKCITQKTSALFSGIALGVAAMAGASNKEKESIEQIFNQAGRVFQMQDDILDLFGDKKRGEVGCDIKEGKVSFLIVKHLVHHPEDFEFTKKILQKPREQTLPSDIERFKQLVVEKNTLQLALEELYASTEAIGEDPYLVQNPELYKNLMDLLSEFLNPINHLNVSEIRLSAANLS
jgi:geranylgeranyl diphosphate synthase type I